MNYKERLANMIREKEKNTKEQDQDNRLMTIIGLIGLVVWIASWFIVNYVIFGG